MRKDLSDLKRSYGDEYPLAVVMYGIRLPLQRESPFIRSYHSPEHKLGTHISRFMDGSASITLAELQEGWPGWTEQTRMDFCQASGWLSKEPEYRQMLRFMMEHSGPRQWAALANRVAAHYPQEEAFDLLLRALQSTELGFNTLNIVHGIAKTRHPRAEAILRSHFSSICTHPALWEDAAFMNWFAYGAITCINSLVELGAQPPEFGELAQKLSQHACAETRKACKCHLAKHYPWLS